MIDDGSLNCSYDVKIPKWVPEGIAANAAKVTIDGAYALKSGSYKAYCKLARNRTLAKFYIHVPFEILYSIIYFALKNVVSSKPSDHHPS